MLNVFLCIQGETAGGIFFETKHKHVALRADNFDRFSVSLEHISIRVSFDAIQWDDKYLLNFFLVLKYVVFEVLDNLQTLLTDKLLINPLP
jgi:hypothetical protein